ncbi:MAG TPA: hypothetical protein VF373_02115 [Prolixibacteraceae bacterium]
MPKAWQIYDTTSWFMSDFSAITIILSTLRVLKDPTLNSHN